MSTDTPEREVDAETGEPTLEGGYDPDTVESRWQRRWIDEDVYAYEADEERDPNTVYAIDTPPPTVSGSLHMGHLYGSTLQDFAARASSGCTTATCSFPSATTTTESRASG